MKKYRLLLICIFLMMTGCSSTGNISSDNVYASQQQYLADMAKELKKGHLTVMDMIHLVEKNLQHLELN